ncbi:hypothetical protein J8L88_07305 [Aquimarina sp. MMG015]|uniref:hypothetical protein n=1 Tax=Aquimarina TaxID=290174 RepID=UPI000485EC87|nr:MULTISPECIES: hypothetical protein [Aquimarina]AXT56649.1 hypothetical protein D1815_13080 [Aquimarina sp. AD1]MBQ4802662.1 hypothetical protein [Aquimarina sp. MMG015]RKN19382.1 hypothetical protein D7035_13935 [Aquimarina sp. AD1]
MLKNLKSLFIVDDSEEENKETSGSSEKADVSSDKKPAASTPPPLPNNPISSSSEGVLDTKIVEKLLQAIEKNNLDGFDYLEYKKSLKALEKMPMDEATKYRSAFATASTMGVTLDKLLQTTNFYIGVLDKENEQFIGAFKNQFDSKVSGREREIAQFESIIKEKSEQIKKLTEEIAKHQKQIGDLKAKVEESNSKINKTQNDFKVSYSHLKAQFEEDIVKMQKYLK